MADPQAIWRARRAAEDAAAEERRARYMAVLRPTRTSILDGLRIPDAREMAAQAAEDRRRGARGTIGPGYLGQLHQAEEAQARTGGALIGYAASNLARVPEWAAGALDIGLQLPGMTHRGGLNLEHPITDAVVANTEILDPVREYNETLGSRLDPVQRLIGDFATPVGAPGRLLGAATRPVREFLAAEQASARNAVGLLGDFGMAGGPPVMTAASPLAQVQGDLVRAGLDQKGVRASRNKLRRSDVTVLRPDRVEYPRIYEDPRELVGRARVAPEDPALKELFGVTRRDLFDISRQGTRQGNRVDPPFKLPPNPRGAEHVERITNPRNTQRMLDIFAEARKRPDLYEGMVPWYVMDPLYDDFVRIHGAADAPAAYERFNNFVGMGSPGSEVLDEINRGTAAHWLSTQGRMDDFMRWGGQAGRPGSPADMAAVRGHIYHKTAQGIPMKRYSDTGVMSMGSPKVPSYISASGVPQTGFQTSWPVADAHFSRIVGLPDVRGKSLDVGKSASTAEVYSLSPWWRDKVAAQAGIEAVPAQATVWGAGSNATGVSSPIGAPKLELLAGMIKKTAARLGITPQAAKDLILRGGGYAGALALLLGGGARESTTGGLARPKPER